MTLACLAASSAPVPSIVAPSENVTVPVGVPEDVELTVAVNVTVCPNPDGFTSEATLVDVDATAAP
jgi:hypothetical protein